MNMKERVSSIIITFGWCLHCLLDSLPGSTWRRLSSLSTVISHVGHQWSHAHERTLWGRSRAESCLTMAARGKQLCWTWTSSTNSEPLTLAFLIVRLLSLWVLSVLLKAVTSLLWVASWALGGRRLVLGVAALCTRTSCQQRNISNSDSLFGPIFGPTKSWPWNWRTWKCRYP